MLEVGRILLIISMVHAYVFALLFFSYKKTSMRILGFFMLTTFAHYFLYLNTIVFHIEELYPVFYYLIPSLSLLTIPLVYLYVKYMTSENYPISKQIWYHLIPSFLFLVSTIYFLVSLSPADRDFVFQGNSDLKTAFPLFLNYLISSFLIIFQAIFYAFKMFFALYRHNKNIEHVYSSKEEVSLKWLKIFVIIYVVYYLFEFAVFLFKGINISETVYFSIISLHVFFVGFMGLKQRDIFKDKAQKTVSEQSLSTETENSESSSKLSVVTPEIRVEVLQKIDLLMNENKVFLNEDLSLYDLAKALDIHKNYLSHIINDSLHSNFYGLINRYRIEEAKKMLTDESFNHLSIEGIAKSVGFKSRSVFYPVFKKMEGITPAEFKAKVQNEKNRTQD